jgi:O-antigen/teichoic acid export membrane protein
LSQSQTPSAGPVRRGANVYFAASGVAQLSALLRYVILARMLGPEQLGLAATLVLTSAFFDYISETGSDRFLIQDRDGDTPAVQKLVHLVHVSRGVTTALALAVLAWPLALAFKAPKLAEGIAILGISRFIVGFIHLDLRRMQRHLDFRIESVCLFTSEISGLIATGLAAYFTKEYTSILYGLTVRSLVLVATSHLLAKRPYEVGLSREHSSRLSRFALPLMANGVLLYFATQGDRWVIQHQLGFAQLGRYSAILLLVYYPVAMLQKYTQAMYMPILARARDNPTERMRASNVMGGQILMLALSISLGFSIVGPIATSILYGHKFTEAALIVGLIGILQTSRYLLVFPTVVALSVGRSFATLTVNLVRLVAYPAAFVGGLTVGGVVIGFVFGELIAHSAGLMLLNQGFKRPLISGFHRIVLFASGSATILGWVWVVQNRALPQGAGLLLVSCLLMAWLIRSERAAITETLAMVRKLGGGLSTRLARA